MNANTSGAGLSVFLQRAEEYPPLPVAVVDAQEDHVLQGVLAASEAGLIEPTLIGQPDVIQRLCRELDCDADRFPIIEADSETAAARTGVELIRDGKAHALIKGWIHTDALMRPVLAQLRTARRISHIFIAELPRYSKLLYITDAAINIAPDLSIKAQIVQNAVDLAHMLGVERPAVAALSSVELVKPAIPSTLSAARSQGRFWTARWPLITLFPMTPQKPNTSTAMSRARRIFCSPRIWMPAIFSPRIWNIWRARPSPES